VTGGGGAPWDLPPPDLHKRDLPIREIERGTPLMRIHSADYHPHFFGPAPPKRKAAGWPAPRNRFDDPQGIYGVCYLGLNDAAAFVETVLRDQFLPVLSAADLGKVCLADGSAARQLRLVEFGGRGLRRLGINAATVHAPYDITRAWSRALWSHPVEPDGICYHSRWDNDLSCVALFSRAERALQIRPGPLITALPARLAAILDRYEIGYAP
jgi:hypothetical protein